MYRYISKSANPIVVDGITILPFADYVSSTPVPVLDRLDGILLHKRLNEVDVVHAVEFNSENPTVNNSQTAGIKLDISDPVFGWMDLLSPTNTYAGAASNKPTYNILVGGIREYQFILNDETFHQFHLPHDYVMGSNLYIHAHWTHNSGSVVGGSVTWQFEVTYARGYSRGVYPATKLLTVTQDASTVALTHMIAETILSVPGGSSIALDSSLIEPDGLVQVRTSLIANSCGANPFLTFCDIHYQSTGIPTKNRNYDFWN